MNEEGIYRLSESYSLFKGDFKEVKYFLFNIEDGTIYKMNSVSYDMLSLFDGNRQINEILDLFLSQYNGEEKQMKSDFFYLVSSWLKKKILVAGGEHDGRKEKL
ncbi:MAG: PqqD family protein [Syntrophomonas sp.]